VLGFWGVGWGEDVEGLKRNGRIGGEGAVIGGGEWLGGFRWGDGLG